MHVFSELGSNDPKLLMDLVDPGHVYDRLTYQKIIYHDQEPIYFNAFEKDWVNKVRLVNRLETSHILSNSEKNSVEKDKLLALSGWSDFYWFSNGFLSLEWYRFYRYAKYLENNWNPTKHFSSYNRIMPNREHRLAIADHLYKHYPKKIILSKHSENSDKNLFIHTDNVKSENLSYVIHEKDFINSFCHVITERIFYENRIHLTEKTFRPIVCCRPFVLVSSPGALAYLKGYGFKTFSDFWSEKYDDILDHNRRLDACLEVLDFIGSLTKKQMIEMLNEMKDILLYNRKHFYNNFEKIITAELHENLSKALGVKNSKATYYEQIINSLTQSEYNLINNHAVTCDANDSSMPNIYSHVIDNFIGHKPKEDIVRDFVKDNIEYFKGYMLGIDFLNQTKRNNLL